MPYVQRNAQGEIVSLLKEAATSASEFLPATHPEVAAFLSDTAGAPDAAASIFSPTSDLEMVRIIEDLVDLLIAKNVIVLTDLPVAVQQKLLRQRERREVLFGDISMDEEGHGGLF